MSKKHEKLAERLATILIELNQTGQVDIMALAERFSVGVRTLQKDLNERLTFLHWEKAGPRYYSINPNQLGVFTQADITRFARFASVQDLFPKLDREFFQQSLTESIKVQGFQYESIQHREKEFKQLQQAIDNHQIIKFGYAKPGQQPTNRTLEPYVLLNKNGIWYVIGLENGKQKTFCFSQMHFLMLTKQTFAPKPKFLEEIKQSDSIYYGNQLTEVIIKVENTVSHYFLRRNLLPNQKLVHKLDDGGLLLSCENVNEQEIIPLVQYWVPYLVVISPIEVQLKLEDKLKQYLTNSTLSIK
ncbi:WYL domain-containing protein [uncultured Aggregatibacter sp.]|uniref:helix-turn-helix transcriptional regulator n=1 Tax=uncultured Aggregatibacter sp. TaxID=470564 RepID=UPI0028053EAA|nr:WYL domain-containing protein [uncultured Aggregatibacter sp.]